MKVACLSGIFFSAFCLLSVFPGDLLGSIPGQKPRLISATHSTKQRVPRGYSGLSLSQSGSRKEFKMFKRIMEMRIDVGEVREVPGGNWCF